MSSSPLPVQREMQDMSTAGSTLSAPLLQTQAAEEQDGEAVPSSCCSGGCLFSLGVRRAAWIAKHPKLVNFLLALKWLLEMLWAAYVTYQVSGYLKDMHHIRGDISLVKSQLVDMDAQLGPALQNLHALNASYARAADEIQQAHDLVVRARVELHVLSIRLEEVNATLSTEAASQFAQLTLLVNSSIRTATASVRTLLADAERTTAGINITVQQLVDTSAQIKLEQSQLFTNLSQFAAIPTGGVTVFSGATLPKGFLHCDGASLSRTRYVALFAVLGTRYGEGAAQDNSTFSLPDLRSRGVVGASGVTRTGAPVDLAAGLSNYPLSSTLGRATHTLLESELPSHTHVVSDPGHTHRATDLGHTHGASSYNFGPEKASWFTSGHLDSSLGMGKANIVVEKATSGIALEHTGRGNAFDIMPPSMALFFIIRT